MSEQTVGTHLRRVYAKLGVHSRGELAGALGALWTGRIPNSEPA
jgi:DNA-binding CsgD family transcriptional regulator